MVGHRSFLVSAALVISCASSGPNASSPPAKAPAKASPQLPAPPPNLAVVVSLPSVDHGVDGLLAFVDAASPENGAALRAFVSEGAGKIDGVDRAEPMRFVVLATASDNQDWGVLVAHTDTTKLKDDFGAVRQLGAWAFIASPTSIDKLAPWALQNLAQQPVPNVPVVTIYPTPILAAHPDAVADARSEWLSSARDANEPIMGALFDDLLDGLKQVERIEVRLDATAVRGVVEVAAFAKSRTGLATYIAAQKPATYELLSRTTTDGAMALAAGRSLPALGGKLYARFVDLLTKSMPKHPLTPTADEVRRIEAMLEGEIAMTIARPEGSMLPFVSILAATPSSDGFNALYEQGLRAPMAYDSADYDGVRIIQVRGTELRFAHWDDVTGFAVSDASRQQMERLVDVSRGRGRDALPTKLALAFEESRRKRESFLVVIDLVGFMTRTSGEDGLALGLGFSGGAVRFRAAVDARHVAAVLSIAGPDAF